MTPDDETRRPAAFCIALDYTDAELRTHQAIIARLATPPTPGYLTPLVVATGFVAALLLAWVADLAGAVRGQGGAIIAGLLFLGFSLGIWAPSIWAWRFNRRHVQAQQALARRQSQGATCVVSGRGLALRLAGARILYPRSTIGGVTLEQGLLLVWPPAGNDPMPILAVPLRLLTPAQRDALASLAPPAPA